MKLTPLTLALIPALLAGQTQAAPTSLGKGEGQLNIVAWAGYVERGETDKNYDWVTGFEKETGCKVNVKTAATSDEMVALMNEGGFDLVTASGDASLRLIAGGKVQALNLALKGTLDGTAPYGSRQLLGIKDGAVGIAKNAWYEKLVPADVRAEVDAIEAKIIAGEIEVATDMK